MYSCNPPVYPLFPCTASLYSLVPFIPGCSVANRRVARAASDWLANSVRPVPARAVLSFRFWISRTGARARPSRPGFNWCAHFGAPRSDWPDSLCSDRGLLSGWLGVAAQLRTGEKGYRLLYSCTHTCICADGSRLPPALIYKGESHNLMSSWVGDFTEEYDAYFASSLNGWSSDELGLQ